MINPFENFDERLRNIENILLDIKHKPIDENLIDKLLTIDEAAKFLKLAKATVYDYVHRRIIPHSKIEKRLYFSQKGLLEWVKSEGKIKTVDEVNASADESIKIRKRKK